MANGNTLTLKPGLLVALSARISGGVSYQRVDLDKHEEGSTDAPTLVEKWETTKVVDDKDEFEAATKVRGKVRSLIAGACSASNFGLLCPAANEDDLNAAIKEAQALVARFNEGAKTLEVGLYVLKGRIAEDETEAARAIGSEVRGLLAEMEEGVLRLDVGAVRAAAASAKKIGQMLDDSVGKKVSAAIAQARAAAREIVRRVDKGGEDAAKVLDEINLDDLRGARFAFLDFEASEAPVGEAMPGAVAREVEVPEEAVAGTDAAPKPVVGTFRDLDDEPVDPAVQAAGGDGAFSRSIEV